MLSSQSLTLYELMALLVSALGFIAVAISLIFLMKQTAASAQQSKLVADSLTSSNYAALATFMFEVEQAFIDYPELRPYFYEGEPVDERNPNHARILAVAGNKLGYFSYLVILSDRFPQLWPRHWWDRYIEAGFVTSPVMRQYVHRYREFYHQELYDLRLKMERRLQSPSQPVSQINARYHGDGPTTGSAQRCAHRSPSGWSIRWSGHTSRPTSC